MSEEEANALLQAMWEEWGDNLPDPEVFPQQFLYYVRFLKYLQRTRGKNE